MSDQISRKIRAWDHLGIPRTDCGDRGVIKVYPETGTGLSAFQICLLVGPSDLDGLCSKLVSNKNNITLSVSAMVRRV